ncbi:type VII toxin-antitoxin system MntA family adenylyltransferase antitoxin [Sulfurimonas sediminis]|nr:nucleotidyltransferase domain-containing protein [Sulfurimonas sediminis]
MINVLQTFFKKYNFDFVLLFGSAVTQTMHEMSDIDIGIFTKDTISLKDLGYISAMLENKLNKRVDISLLRDLEKKDPNFVFSILENHQLITLQDETSYIDFKTKAQLSYLDHKELIETNLKGLKNRIENGNFARRNYA